MFNMCLSHIFQHYQKIGEALIHFPACNSSTTQKVLKYSSHVRIVVVIYPKLLCSPHTFIANRSPVVLFFAKNTRPNAPRLIGFIISKSSIEVRSLEECTGLLLRLRKTSSSKGASSSITVLVISTLSSSTSSHSCKYFSLGN